MTAQSSIPLKWYVPFANGDSGRTELPVTTADPTRASQTLGFPPLTMQPPESGGVPPQGEDFNGGMNQVARIAWWVLNCGGWPFDSTFATNSNINGYPNGATVQAADFRGNWINTADNNQNNPDTVGTSWVPGFQYGTTAVTGVTGGTVTLTPAQASKNGFTVAGVLASAATIILPNWTKNWTVTNNTTGAFVLIVKTLAGSGITIPQNGAPTRVSGDGTNITQSPENIGAATSSTQAMQLGQATGRLLSTQGFFTAGTSTYTPTAGTARVRITCIGGGGSGGGAGATSTGQVAAGGGGGAGAVTVGSFAVATVTGLTVTVGAGGAAASATGNVGGTSAVGGVISAQGGSGGGVGNATSPPTISAGGSGGAPGIGGNIFGGAGGAGGAGICSAATNGIGGAGGQSYLSGGAGNQVGTANGNNGQSCGAGGGGAINNTAGQVARASGSGATGVVLIDEYA
jgi:hypothetical protein